MIIIGNRGGNIRIIIGIIFVGRVGAGVFPQRRGVVVACNCDVLLLLIFLSPWLRQRGFIEDNLLVLTCVVGGAASSFSAALAAAAAAASSHDSTTTDRRR